MFRSLARPVSVVAALAAASFTFEAEPAAAKVEQAKKAYDFVDSIGIVGHVSRRKGVLDADGWIKIREAIGEAGFRYMRTTITNNTGISRVQDIHGRYGVRFNYNVDSRSLESGDPQEIPLNPSLIDDMLAMIKLAGVDAILSVEGPNEYSSQEREGNDNWPAELKDFQRMLYNQVKKDLAIAGKVVLAPSIWRRKLESYQRLGDISSITDKGTLHKYHSGRMPTYKLDESVQDAKILTPDDPLFVTEYGYSSAANYENVWYPITEYSQAKYLARYTGEFFIHPDVEKAFVYQIIDEKPIANAPDKAKGLLRNDFSKRPAFYSLKNTIALLDDDDDDFTPDSLNFDLIGDLTDVHYFLVQKKNGVFFLVIWQEVESYDRNTRTDLFPADRQLNLAFNTPITQVRTYLPTGLDIDNPEDGRLPIDTHDNPTSVLLNVPDELLVVEIVTGEVPEDAIVVSAGASLVSGDAPLNVDFTGSAQPAGSYGYSWDFGDGKRSSLPNPSHTYSLPGTYRAVLTVGDGTETAEDAVTIYVMPEQQEEDTKKPTVPKNLTAELVSKNQIDFSWTPSTDNVGVAHYNIYEDGRLIATSSGPVYSFSAKKSKWYTFEVSAEDAAGNESARSDDLKVYIYKNRLITR